MGYFQVDNGQVEIFLNLNSIRKVAEEKMMMLRRWAVREQRLVVPFGVYEL